MSTKAPTLSATALAASSRAAATRRVRVCHYGTGASPLSPVVVWLPPTITAPQPVVMTLGMADEVCWLYDNDFAVAADLSGHVNRIVSAMKHGDYNRAHAYVDDARAHWYRVTPIPEFSYEGHSGPDEAHLDATGRIAAYADTYPDSTAATASYFPTSWGSEVTVPSLRLATRRAAWVTGLIVAIVGGAFASGAPWLSLVAPFPAMGYTYRFPYVDVSKLSVAKWAAYEALPDPRSTAKANDEAEQARRKKVRQEFAEAIVDLDDEATFDRASRLLRDEMVRRWNDGARRRIEEEVGVLSAANDDEPRSLMARVLADDAESVNHSPDHDLLVASQALLEEFAQRRNAAS